jgi:hypothetical protein
MSSPSAAEPALAAVPAARERIFMRVFAIGAGLTVLAGTAAMIAAGVGPGLWLRNPAAWIVTLAACAGLVRLRMPPRPTLCVLLALLALSFAGHGQQGVHRWIGFGPVQMNAAALVLPLALVLAARDARIVSVIVMVPMAGLLAWQPDMSQLAALTAGLLAWAVVRRDVRALAWIVPLALAALYVCAHRPDPLDPVPYVEGILHLAWTVSPPLALAGGICLLLTALSPLIVATDAQKRPAAVALAAYFVVSSAAWLFGAFPVPLAGYGLSFMLGWGFGAAALLAYSNELHLVNANPVPG